MSTRTQGVLRTLPQVFGDSVGLPKVLRSQGTPIANHHLEPPRSSTQERFDISVNEEWGDPWQHVRPSEVKPD